MARSKTLNILAFFAEDTAPPLRKSNLVSLNRGAGGIASDRPLVRLVGQDSKHLSRDTGLAPIASAPKRMVGCGQPG